jgi:hypothetical protein
MIYTRPVFSWFWKHWKEYRTTLYQSIKIVDFKPDPENPPTVGYTFYSATNDQTSFSFDLHSMVNGKIYRGRFQGGYLQRSLCI